MAPAWRIDPKTGAHSVSVDLETIPADFESAGGKYRALRVSVRHDKDRKRRAVHLTPIVVERSADMPAGLSFECYTCQVGERATPETSGFVVPMGAPGHAARLDRRALARIAGDVARMIESGGLAAYWTAGDFVTVRDGIAGLAEAAA